MSAPCGKAPSCFECPFPDCRYGGQRYKPPATEEARAKKNARNAAWYAKNKERIAAQRRARYQENYNRIQDKRRAYYNANRERLKANQRERHKTKQEESNGKERT